MSYVAKSSIPYYISLDVDHDVSADTLIVTLDNTQSEGSWVTATYHASPPATAPVTPTSTGFTRYWWSFTSGTGAGELPLTFGLNRVHGKLTDTPSGFYTVWNINAAAE